MCSALKVMHRDELCDQLDVSGVCSVSIDVWPHSFLPIDLLYWLLFFYEFVKSRSPIVFLGGSGTVPGVFRERSAPTTH